MTDEADFARVIEDVVPGAHLARVERLSGGISAGMFVLEIERPGHTQDKLVLRIPGASALSRNPTAARDEFRLLSELAAQGLPVPAPIHVDETCLILPTPFLLIQHVPGRTELFAGDLAARIEQYAGALMRIHRAKTDRLGFLPNLSETIPDWIDGLASQAAPDASRVLEVLKRNWPWPQRNEARLLHGDFWPGNVLWSDGRISAIVDWEESLIGDPLADLAVTRLDMLWAFGAEAMDGLTRAYLSIANIDAASLPYWDLCATLRPEGNFDEWAAPWAGFGRADVTGDSMRADCAWFAGQALARLKSAAAGA